MVHGNVCTCVHEKKSGIDNSKGYKLKGVAYELCFLNNVLTEPYLLCFETNAHIRVKLLSE